MSVVSRLGLKWEIFYIFLVLETWYEEICLPDCHNLRTLILKRLLWDLKLELENKPSKLFKPTLNYDILA